MTLAMKAAFPQEPQGAVDASMPEASPLVSGSGVTGDFAWLLPWLPGPFLAVFSLVSRLQPSHSAVHSPFWANKRGNLMSSATVQTAFLPLPGRTEVLCFLALLPLLSFLAQRNALLLPFARDSSS